MRLNKVLFKSILFLTIYSIFCYGQLRSPFTRIADVPYEVSDQSNSLYQFSIYLAGGCGSDQHCLATDPSCFCTDILSKICRYDLINNRFDVISNELPRARYRHTGDVVNFPEGPGVTLLGGRNALDQIVEEIDVFLILQDQWVVKGVWDVLLPIMEV